MPHLTLTKTQLSATAWLPLFAATRVLLTSALKSSLSTRKRPMPRSRTSSLMPGLSPTLRSSSTRMASRFPTAPRLTSSAPSFARTVPIFSATRTPLPLLRPLARLLLRPAISTPRRPTVLRSWLRRLLMRLSAPGPRAVSSLTLMPAVL